MVLIEICYCKITGKTRDLPKIHHFIPLEPWEAKKIKGKKKRMKSVVEMTTADHAKAQSARREQIKLVLDMSNEGPMFKMLENMLGSAGSSMVNQFLKKHNQIIEIFIFYTVGSKCVEKITQIWNTRTGRVPFWRS